MKPDRSEAFRKLWKDPVYRKKQAETRARREKRIKFALKLLEKYELEQKDRKRKIDTMDRDQLVKLIAKSEEEILERQRRIRKELHLSIKADERKEQAEERLAFLNYRPVGHGKPNPAFEKGIERFVAVEDDREFTDNE